MTEEIKYNKDEKWVPYKQLEETPQQTIARLEQENKDFEILAKSLYKRIEELEKENEALTFREGLYKADYEASEQENKENCNFQQNYNMFGLDDKPCCYLYHKYCNEIDDCYYKQLQELKMENKKLKEVLNGNI